MTIPTVVVSLLAVLVVAGLVFLVLTRTALGRSFKVPLRQTLRRPVTQEYPEVKRAPEPRFHGRHQLNFYEDGLEKCIGCELCAWICPADAIFVQGADNTAVARYSPGERYASDYQINYNRCIFCALCIEACPTRALTMTHDYELSADTREGLIYTKERLLAPLPAGVKPAPHPDAEVRSRGVNYYGGLAATPPDLVGGEYEPAGPRNMQSASSALGGLRERTETVPAYAQEEIETVEMGPGAVMVGADVGHLREAGRAPQEFPVLEAGAPEEGVGGRPDVPAGSPERARPREDGSQDEGGDGDKETGG